MGRTPVLLVSLKPPSLASLSLSFTLCLSPPSFPSFLTTTSFGNSSNKPPFHIQNFPKPTQSINMHANVMGSFPLAAAIFTMALPSVLASCAHGTQLFARNENDAGKEVVDFSYKGANVRNIMFQHPCSQNVTDRTTQGPENWATLAPENAVCATGRNQSPIDMVSSSFKIVPGDSLNLKIADMEAGAEFVNLGTTVEVKPEGGNGGTMTVDGTQYTMRQFHFHLPSEHLDAGTQRAMEMHMVFESSDSQLAVIGTYIDVVGATAKDAPAPRCEESASKAARRQATADQAKGHGLRFRSLENRQKGSNSTGTSPLLETVLSNVGEIEKKDAKMTTPPLIMSEVVSLLSKGDFQRYVL